MIVIYARVSTEEQARSGFSLQEQLKACRIRAAEITQGAGERPVVVEFQDDMSGEILERPGLQAALALLRREAVSHFVCLDPDRLARRLMHQLLITDQIESTKCQLDFVQHDYQDTPEGRLFYQLRGAVAEFEKAKILERMMRGSRGKIAAGGIPHNVRIYGYSFRVGAGKAAARDVLVPHQREAEWVRTIFRWCADEGLGPQAIAGRLNSLGVPSKLGRLWNHPQVRSILKQPVFATGRLALQTRDHRGILAARQLRPAERKRKGITLTARRKPKDAWQYVDVEPIVDMAVWERAQQTLAGFRIGGRAHPNNVHMLTGLGRCGLCGGPLYYLCGRKIVCGDRYRRYWSTRATASACTLPAKSHQAVEAAVWRSVRTWLIEPDLLRAEAARLASEEPKVTDRLTGFLAEVATLEKQITEKQGEVQRLGLLFARGLWSADQALPAIETTNRKLTALQDRRAELRQRLAVAPRPDPDSPLRRLLDDPAWLEQVRATLEELNATQQAELIRIMVAHYTMQPSHRGEPPHIAVSLKF